MKRKDEENGPIYCLHAVYMLSQTAQAAVDRCSQIPANQCLVRSVISQSTTEYTFVPK